MNKSLLVLLAICFILTGCSSIQTTGPIEKVSSITERSELLRSLTHWEISGKIAFITAQDRQSANIHWSVKENQQSLNMTTYLGINVLSINEQDKLATIEVDGKTYESDDLELLILQLTNLRLPTEALHYWIKGLPFLTNDSVSYNTAGLPETLTSQYDNMQWQVNYRQYQSVNGTPLAQKLTITQGQLTIKLAINRWVI